MDVWKHSIVSAIIAVVLYPFFGWWCLLAIVGGFLIDADHYFWYIVIKKDIHFMRCYRHCQKARPFNSLHIFHTAEFFLFAALLALVYWFTVPFLLGLIGHLIMDILHMMSTKQKGGRATSLIYWIYAVIVQKKEFTT